MRSIRAYIDQDGAGMVPAENQGQTQMTTTGEPNQNRKLYRIYDDGGVEEDIYAADLSDAIDKMRDWMANAEDGFDASAGTVYYSARLYEIGEDEDGDETEDEVHQEEMSFDMPEPDCTGPEHEWKSPCSLLGGLRENPGVEGHGGGVIIRECCAHCGTYRVTDTWAQRSDTGEQGLHEVTYEDADDASREWLARRRKRIICEAIDTITGADTLAQITDTEWQITVVDDPDDDGDQTIASLKAALPGWDVGWTGDSNTDANDETAATIYLIAPVR